MTETRFALIGMEELVPGVQWKGSRKQIEQAVGETGAKVISREDGMWKVKVGERTLEIRETVSSAKTVDAERVVLAGHDDEVKLAAKLVPPEPGKLDVIVHGDVDSFYVVRDGTELRLDPRQLAAYIRKSGIKFGRIRLLACQGGVHPKGAAQHLANALGVPVEAPSDKLYIHPDGTLSIGPAPNRNTGKFIEFEPKPSETRYTKSPDPDDTPHPQPVHDEARNALELGPKKKAPPRELAVGKAKTLNEDNVDDVIEKLKQGRQLSDEEEAAIRRQAANKGEKWNLSPTLRGEVSHVLAGENLPRTFETIDKASVATDARGNATTITSLKSHQLYAEEFQQRGGLLATLTSEIDELASFPPNSTRNGRTVKRGPNTQLVLQVEVPPNTLGDGPGGDATLRKQWQSEAMKAEDYAKTKDVKLVFKEAPRR
jgi:hypothetical protein